MQRVLGIVIALFLFLGAFQQKSCQQKQGTRGGEGAPAELASQREVERTIESLRVALEGHSLRSFMESVDPVMFDDYAGFEEQIDRLLRESGELRVLLRVANVQVRSAVKDQPARAQAQVDAEMAVAPKDKPGESWRRHAQLTMSFEYSVKGWRLTRLQPRDFFSL